MKFNRSYFFLFLLLFIVEASIAYFVKGGFVRHTLGDVLAVIMIYCLLKSFFDVKPLYMAIFVLCISICVEYLQYFDFVKRIGLADNKIANLVLGNTYQFTDLVAYLFGILIVIFIENRRSKRLN